MWPIKFEEVEIDMTVFHVIDDIGCDPGKVMMLRPDGHVLVLWETNQYAATWHPCGQLRVWRPIWS